MRYFFSRQIKELRREGFKALLRKMMALFSMILTIPLAVPIVLLVRLLRPLVTVRFGSLPSQRIGNFAIGTELYLCRRDTDGNKKSTFDLFYHSAGISNRQLKKMWSRILHVSGMVRWLEEVNRLIPDSARHRVPQFTYRDTHGLTARTPPHLSFTTDEERLGQEGLRKLGVPDGSPFVCFHTRSQGYLNTVLGGASDWSYHDYRDSDINNYIPAAEELVRRGYFALRMGAVVKERLKTNNLRIIDYAVNGRTDFMDIFLGAKCSFFIGTGSGISEVPMIFRRPIAWVNIIPIEYVVAWRPDDLFIPKKLWLKEEKRFLTFKEILDSGIGRYRRSEQYRKAGIEPVENTSEEITSLAVEMDERLKGKWQTNGENEELQRRFWSLFKPSELNNVFLSRIGAEFLHQNKELLN